MKRRQPISVHDLLVRKTMPSGASWDLQIIREIKHGRRFLLELANIVCSAMYFIDRFSSWILKLILHCFVMPTYIEMPRTCAFLPQLSYLYSLQHIEISKFRFSSCVHFQIYRLLPMKKIPESFLHFKTRTRPHILSLFSICPSSIVGPRGGRRSPP